MKKTLRHGYTTGACAAAAAKGAALLLRDRAPAGTVTITLPNGEQAGFMLLRQELEGDCAICSIIKDAGDDPDITNGAEIVAAVSVQKGAGGLAIAGGAGVGRVTKPGLAVPVGDWAINPVPRQMITKAIQQVFPAADSLAALHVSISIPNGEELAKKTLNARLGIIGGLSILGTTGIVKPISAKAWTDTIDAAIDVAIASGCRSVIFSTGRTSEIVAQKFFEEQRIKKPEEAFVMMGDHVGYALKSAAGKGVSEVVLACQFAKLLKIACGHEQTHVSSSELDLEKLAEWVGEEQPTFPFAQLARRANTARQVLEESGNNAELLSLVCSRAKSFAKRLLPDADLKVLLAGYDSKVIYFA